MRWQAMEGAVVRKAEYDGQTSGGRNFVDIGPIRVYFGAKHGKFPECNQLVVRGRESRAAVDASISSNLIGPDFENVDFAVLSHVHEDHLAGLSLLPATPLDVPERDLAAMQSWEGMVEAIGLPEEHRAATLADMQRDFFYAPRPDATGFPAGKVWELGGVRMEAVATPGHTPGHSALLFPDEGVAFIADIDLSSFGPYYGDRNASITEFRASLEVVRALPARIWITGHHRGIYRDRAQFLHDLAAYGRKIDAREAKLREHLREKPLTLDELAARRLTYPPSLAGEWFTRTDRVVIGKHLELMIASGEVIAHEEGLYELVQA